MKGRTENGAHWSSGRLAASGRTLLKKNTAALLTERVRLLRAEADHQAVLLLVVRDELHDVLHGLRHGDAFDRRLAPQLLRHLPLLLQVGDHHVHNSSVRQAYFYRVW